MTHRHADPCDCGDPQHCGAFGCPCMTVYPDQESPCGVVGCGRGSGYFWHWAQADIMRHPHVPTLCATCHHAIEAKA